MGPCRSDLPPQRRPLFILCRWVNALVEQRPRTPGDLHLTFSDGHTLCLMLERLRPGTRLRKFSRAVTRATACGNLEQALALVWNHLPSPSCMPSAAQILDGAPREINLKFIDQLYSIFVVRPARARLAVAARWLNEMLRPYQLRLTDAAAKPPHAALGAELRSCVPFAILLHTCLPAQRCADLQHAVYWHPASETERQRSVRAIMAVLEQERLAPCSAEELLASAKLPAGAAYRGPFGSAASNGNNYYPLRSSFATSTAKADSGLTSPRGSSWACGPGRDFTTPSGSACTAGPENCYAGAGGAVSMPPAPLTSSSGSGGVVPLTGGPPTGPELEAELLCIMLSAAYQRFARAAPPYGTAGDRRLLTFRDDSRQRPLPVTSDPPTPKLYAAEPSWDVPSDAYSAADPLPPPMHLLDPHAARADSIAYAAPQAFRPVEPSQQPTGPDPYGGHPYATANNFSDGHYDAAPPRQTAAPGASRASAAAQLLAEVDDFLIGGQPPLATMPAPLAPPLAPPPSMALPPHSTGLSRRNSKEPPPPAQSHSQNLHSHHRRLAYGLPPIPPPAAPSDFQPEPRFPEARSAWEAAAARPSTSAPSVAPSPAVHMTPRNLGFQSAEATPARDTGPGGAAGSELPARPPQLGTGRPRQPKPTQPREPTTQPQPGDGHRMFSQLPSSTPTPVAVPSSAPLGWTARVTNGWFSS